jgi:hypothetical protein
LVLNYPSIAAHKLIEARNKEAEERKEEETPFGKYKVMSTEYKRRRLGKLYIFFIAEHIYLIFISKRKFAIENC